MASIIVKCIERCNAQCAYCDVEKSHAGVLDMSADTLRAVFYRIDEYLGRHREEKVTFIWHGGEPLLLGADYLSLAYDLQNELCPQTRDRIDHSIQSNLTVLNERHIAALKKLGIRSIGSSYEPELEVRGLGHKRDSGAYNRAFLRATTLLEQHDMSWGIIYVVTKKSLADPLAVFLTLTNLLPARGFLMNPVIISGQGPQELAISPEEFADFLGAIFPFWLERRRRFPQVEPLASYWTNLAEKGRHLYCAETGNCASSHLNIDPNGNVSKCGRSSDLHVMSYGNIHDRSIDEMFEISRKEMGGRTRALRDGECSGCNLFPICHGGCPLDGYAAHGDFNRKTGWCEAKKLFVSKYFEPLTGITAEGLTDYFDYNDGSR